MDPINFCKSLFTSKKIDALPVVKRMRNIARKFLLERHPNLDETTLQKHIEILVRKAHSDLQEQGYCFTPLEGVTESPEMAKTLSHPEAEAVRKSEELVKEISNRDATLINSPESSSELRKKSLTPSAIPRPIQRSRSMRESRSGTNSEQRRSTGIPAPVESARLVTPRQSKKDDLLQESCVRNLNADFMLKCQLELVNMSFDSSKNLKESPKMFSRNQSLQSSVRLKGENAKLRRVVHAKPANLHFKCE